MIDAAQALVPPDSSLTAVSDNEGSYALLSGDYYARVAFDDGGLALEDVLAAVGERAAAEGWVERYRCDRPGAVKVGYSRDNLKISVTVWKPIVEENDNSIRVQRLGDGNDWPPRDCSLA
jgi:hypothetical protein